VLKQTQSGAAVQESVAGKVACSRYRQINTTTQIAMEINVSGLDL